MTAEEKKAYLQKALQNSVLVMKETDKKMGKVSIGNTPPYPTIPENYVDNYEDESMLVEDQYRQQHNVNKNINNSKLPDAIKESFLKSPSLNPQSNIPPGMESVLDVLQVKPPKQVKTSKPNPINVSENTVAGMDIKLLEFIIKSTVMQTLEEVSKKTTVDENFQIKIGDKVFSGKLSVLTENKKKKK